MVEKVTRQTWTINEVATMLGVSGRHVYQLARDGKLPFIRLGARFVMPREAFEELLKGKNGHATPTE